MKRPPRGTLGIVPQKNVLFPDLTCYQTLRVWRAIKYSSHPGSEDDDYEQLLRDCDLGTKIHSNASTLSGGQKRKLQLAVGLVGGSRIVLVDECTSGVDPLSRRALWRALTSVKHDRTIVFTTHFLDEADLLADHIAILAAPGKLVAEGSPVALKTNLGRGYSVQVTFDSKDLSEKDPASSSLEVLDCVREFAPQCTLSRSSPTHAAYHLKSKDPVVVEKVLQLLDNEAESYHIASVDVLGTSIEDIFLDLMESEVRTPDSGQKSMQESTQNTLTDHLRATSAPSPFLLADGRARSPFSQALTIFHKRMLIARRSWLTPVLSVLIAVCGACIPLFFLSGQTPSCTVTFDNETVIPLYWPASPLGLEFTPTASILESPPNITATLGRSAMFMLTENVPDNATFVSTIQRDYLNIPIGGISIDMQTGDALVAWDATPPPGFAGPTLLNLATNILYNRALNASGDTAGTPSIIMANYASFPAIAGGTLEDLKWVAFFGAAMVRFPRPPVSHLLIRFQGCVPCILLAICLTGATIVSPSNAAFEWSVKPDWSLARPLALGFYLWRHYRHDCHHHFRCHVQSVLWAWAVRKSLLLSPLSSCSPYLDQWVVLAQYGIVGALFSYCVSLIMSSPLTSFAAVAGYQIVMYVVSEDLSKGRVRHAELFSAVPGCLSPHPHVCKDLASKPDNYDYS